MDYIASDKKKKKKEKRFCLKFIGILNENYLGNFSDEMSHCIYINFLTTYPGQEKLGARLCRAPAVHLK